MLKPLVLVIAAVIGSGSTTPDSPRGFDTPTVRPAACPADHPTLKQRVVRVIESPATRRFRESDGWANVVSSANLQVLTDPNVCEWLRNNVTFATPDRITSYYVADGYYFVATERLRIQPAGTIVLGGWEPVIVFRSDLSLVGSYAT
jgi:hypothetical protein